MLVTGGLRLDLDGHTLTVNGRSVELTRTEFNLLETFMQNPGFTLTRDDLLEKALGYAYEGMGRALDTHIRNLRRKIEPDPDAPTYIQTVYGVGYRLTGGAMNRLWVRLSLMIGGVLFLVFFLQFLSIMTSPDIGQPPGIIEQPGAGQPLDDGGPMAADPAEIARRLVNFMVLSIVVGLGAGIVIARIVSAPISDLTKAAHRIGQGDLGVRVRPRGSQEMVELAETFNKMAADLQHAETLRNNLMADVSHELRTPLTVLEGNLRAVLDHVYALDEAEIANLYGQTRHLIRLVSDLRELALAENHQLPLERQPTDLNALVARPCRPSSRLLPKKACGLRSDGGVAGTHRRSHPHPASAVQPAHQCAAAYARRRRSKRQRRSAARARSTWWCAIPARGWNRISLRRSLIASTGPTNRAAAKPVAPGWAWPSSRRSSRRTRAASRLSATAEAAAAGSRSFCRSGKSRCFLRQIVASETSL